MNDQTVGFIEERLRKGSTREEIKAMLMKVGGWTSEEVEKSFAVVSAKNAPTPQAVPTVSASASPITAAMSPKSNIPSVSPSIAVSNPTALQNSSTPVVLPPVPPMVPKVPSYSANIQQAPILQKPPLGFQTSIPTDTSKNTVSATPSAMPIFPSKTPSAMPSAPIAAPIKPADIMQRPPVSQVFAMPEKQIASGSNTFMIVVISSLISAMLGAGAMFIYFSYFVPATEEMLIDNIIESDNNIPAEEQIPTIDQNMNPVSPSLQDQELPPVVELAPSTITEPTQDVVSPEPVPVPSSEEEPFVND